MNITISEIHLQKDPKIQKYANKKIKKLLRYNPQIQDINVRLISESAHRGQEKDYYCEITAKVPKKTLKVIDVERTIDKAIDKATERMKKTLIKYREKKISKLHKMGIIAKLLSRKRNLNTH